MKVIKTKQEWQKQLTPEEFNVCREQGTEAPFSGKFYDNREVGIYNCICCGEPLFQSVTKFDSGTGWPSYYESIKGSIIELEDSTYGMRRIEVKCSTCDAHLGHLFPDGPEPTGLRYCINSVCLNFEKGEK